MGYARLGDESPDVSVEERTPLSFPVKSAPPNGNVLANGGYSPGKLRQATPDRQNVEIESDADYSGSKCSPGGEFKPETLVQKIFPTGFRYELVELIKYSWPMVASTLLNTSIRSMATMFSGHLGKIELDSVAMALSIANVIGTSIGIGLIAACDTLFSQSFGSANKLQVGVYLQTAVYVSSLCCVVSWGLLVNTNVILLALGQDPLVSRYTEEYLYYFMPALLFIFLYQLAARYLQVQGFVVPIVLIGILSNLINAGLQYVLVYPANLRLMGSAISQVVAYMSLGFFTIIYARVSGAYKGTWGGFSRSSLKDWGQFFKLGLSSIMMICLEWWAFEIGTFLMGILGATELGASAILMTLWGFYSALSVGIGSAAAYRTGRYLGSMKPRNAITAARVAFCVAWIIALFTALITLTLKEYLPYLFTSDPEVVTMASGLLPILALFSFAGATRNICSGIIRGTGNQAVGGITSFVSYFVFGLPIGIPLMFLSSAGAAGFWWGLTLGLVLNSSSLFIIIYRIDWATEADKAQIRAKVKASLSRQTSVYNRPEAEDVLTNETAALLSGQVTEALNKEIARRQFDKTGSYGAIDDGKPLRKPPDKSSLTESFFLREKQKQQSWTKLYIKRGLTSAICFALFGFGILCRVFILIPPEVPMDLVHYFNVTTMTVPNTTHTMMS